MTTNLNDYSNAFVLITNGKHAGRYGFVESIHESFKDGALGIVSGLDNGDRFESLISVDDVKMLDHEDAALLGEAKKSAIYFYLYDINAKLDYLKMHGSKHSGDYVAWLRGVIQERANILKQITNN